VAPEQVEVGAVDLGVAGDERGLAVARRHRAGAEHGQRQRAGPDSRPRRLHAGLLRRDGKVGSPRLPQLRAARGEGCVGHLGALMMVAPLPRLVQETYVGWTTWPSGTSWPEAMVIGVPPAGDLVDRAEAVHRVQRAHALIERLLAVSQAELVETALADRRRRRNAGHASMKGMPAAGYGELPKLAVLTWGDAGE